MDKITTGISINFYCEYPCAQCPKGNPSRCELCYQTSVERYFYESKCLAECPSRKVETANLTCTDCVSPCVTCDGSPNFCLTCIDGYYVVDGGKCREEVTWYFPFVIAAVVLFILIIISEIIHKKDSNFKESLIALWSIPEVLAWVCLNWFMWHRVASESYATSLAVIAAILYVCINTVHAIIHPRYMVPNTFDNYKLILEQYKCGTFMVRVISYVISFKFSLILVSSFFNAPPFKGSYTAMNWKQFNRFSLAFILLPYSCMMAACTVFIMTDGFWSYPGFVAAEVILLSTFVAILLAIDAISAMKCKTVGKAKTNKAIKPVMGADPYESDQSEMDLRNHVNRQAKAQRSRGIGNDFGEDDSENGSSGPHGTRGAKKTRLPRRRNDESDDDDYDQEFGDDENDSVSPLKQQTKGQRSNKRSGRRLDSSISYNSRLSAQTQLVNEEARKQIAMLEELAHQMREEKRQLQLDKERIAREK